MGGYRWLWEFIGGDRWLQMVIIARNGCRRL